MNRGVLQSSPVQQMMAAGNPSWWSINNTRPPPILSSPHHLIHHHQQQQASNPFLSPPPFSNHFLYGQYGQPHEPSVDTNDDDDSPPSNSSSNNSSSLPHHVPVAWSNISDSPDQFPESWSQLLLGGFVGDEDRENMGHFQAKKLQEDWEDQVAALHHHHHQAVVASSANNPAVDIVKQEGSPPSNYVYGHASEEFNINQAAAATWSSPLPPPPPATISSPTSCVTSFNSSNNNNNMVDLISAANNKADPRHPPPDRSSDCNSNANGGALKKARVLPSSNQQPTCKVRKEKLGDRITSLHQLVSPFGKTDTASVLLEAIGYIRFLQNQIEALSLPYLGSGSSNMRQQHSVQGERSCLFPEDPGQLLDEKSSKKSGTSEKDHEQGPKKDLRSRGLCLVPVSCTLQVGSDNGADYWAPALGGGFQ